MNGKTLPANETTSGEILLYQTAYGGPALEVRLEKETVWLSQRQMAHLFEKNTDTIGLHIHNIFKEGELEEGATTEESSVVQVVELVPKLQLGNPFPPKLRLLVMGGYLTCSSGIPEAGASELAFPSRSLGTNERRTSVWFRCRQHEGRS